MKSNTQERPWYGSQWSSHAWCIWQHAVTLTCSNSCINKRRCVAPGKSMSCEAAMSTEGGAKSGVHLVEADSGTGQGEGELVTGAGLASPAQPAQAEADEGQEPEHSDAPSNAAAAPGTEERQPDATPSAAEGKRRRGRPPGSLNRKTIARMEAARMLQARSTGLTGSQVCIAPHASVGSLVGGKG